MPAVTLDALAAADLALCRAIRGLPHHTVADQLLAGASRATDHAAGWVALAVLGASIDRRRRTRWLRAAAVVAAAQGASVRLKRLMPRDRPVAHGVHPLAPVTTPLSFPSSHTATACAAIDAYETLLPRAVLVGVAIAYGASRPYLGVHYPSDVVAGALLGRIVGRTIGRPRSNAGPSGMVRH